MRRAGLSYALLTLAMVGFAFNGYAGSAERAGEQADEAIEETQENAEEAKEDAEDAAEDAAEESEEAAEDAGDAAEEAMSGSGLELSASLELVLVCPSRLPLYS